MENAVTGQTAIIVDDHALVRQGVRASIQSLPELHIIAEGENGIDAISLVKKHRPSVIILDIAMPHANGIEVIDEIKRWSPETKIIILTGMTSQGLLTQAKHAGANGIFSKSDKTDEFCNGILSVLNGAFACSKRVEAAISTDCIASTLTPRELQVLQGLVRGETNIIIAQRFGISANTVDKHRTSIMRKLSVHSAGELIATALREGLVDAAHQQ